MRFSRHEHGMGMLAMQDCKGVRSTSRVSRLGVKAHQSELFLRALLRSSKWHSMVPILWFNVTAYITQDMTATLQHIRAFQQGTTYVNQTKRKMA